VLRVNLLGTFTVMRLASEAIAKTEPDVNGQRGLVVHTASIATFEAQVGQLAYAASPTARIYRRNSAARFTRRRPPRSCGPRSRSTTRRNQDSAATLERSATNGQRVGRDRTLLRPSCFTTPSARTASRSHN
jgi:hypothetical protein